MATDRLLATEPYSELVGQTITDVRLLENQFHKVGAHPIGFTELRSP